MEEPTCILACDGSEHHMTRVNGMDEVGGKGAPLADSLNWALICLMHQDDSLQERLYMCLGLQAAKQECGSMPYRLHAHYALIACGACLQPDCMWCMFTA